MVLPLVHWWWRWCCLFLRQCTTVRRSTMQVVVAVAAVAVAVMYDEDGVQLWQRGGVQWQRQRSTVTAVGATDRR
jgi:hypothetical protein